jgi:hypothetical protein
MVGRPAAAATAGDTTSGMGRHIMTVHPYDQLDDNTVLQQLRQACADRTADPDADHDDARLFALRDVALARGLPLPSSCPLDAA